MVVGARTRGTGTGAHRSLANAISFSFGPPESSPDAFDSLRCLFTIDPAGPDRLDDFRIGPALGLGRIHGGVGVAHQGIGIAAVAGIHGNAYARCHYRVVGLQCYGL